MQQPSRPVGGQLPNRILKLVGLICLTQLPILILGLLIRVSHPTLLADGVALYFFIALYLGAIWLTGYLYFRDSGEHLNWLTPRNWGTVVIGYFGILLANGLSQAISRLAGHSSEATNQETIKALVSQSHSVGLVMLVLSLVIFAPVLEELIFRGVLMNWFFRKNRWAAVILSALVFGGMHVAGDPNWQFTIIGYAGMGAVLALVYLRSHNIAVDITLHMLNNAVATLMLLSMVGH